MSEIINPILAHRMEVRNKILKGFESDIIEKAPQNTGKLRRRRLSKNGNWYWDYNSPDSSKLITGDDEITSSGRHITKNSKMLMIYTDKMKAELKDIIDSADGFEFTREDKAWKKSKTTSSYYLRFRKDGIRFSVRTSDHTQSSDNYAVIYAVNIETKNKRRKNGTIKEIETWVIDTTLGNIPPKNIGKLVTKISKLWKKYNSDYGHETLKKFAEEQDIKPETSEDIETMEKELAEKFINENNLKEDKLRTTYQVIRTAGRKVLESMLEDEDDED